jgi:integrase
MHFVDHLTPAVLLSINTGLRRGEVLKLRWSSVDFSRRLLTVEGRSAKGQLLTFLSAAHVAADSQALDYLERRALCVQIGFASAARLADGDWDLVPLPLG